MKFFNLDEFLINFSKKIFFLFFFTVFISSIFLLVNIKINAASFFLSFFLMIIYDFVKKKKIEKVDVVSFVSLIIFIGLLLLYFSNFIESSYDGQAYHGNAMVNLVKGVNLFLEQGKYPADVLNIWGDYYPKATWFFGASLIKTFGFLSASLITNVLISTASAFYCGGVCLRYSKSKVLAFVTILFILLNPIAISQSHVYYVDALLGNLAIVLVFMGYDLHQEFSHYKCLEIVMITVLLMNIKFTGLGFGAVINFGIWLYFIFKNRKVALQYVFYGFLMLFIGIVIVGFSPYFLNLINQRHIFYPLVGSDNTDIITKFIPSEMLNMNAVRKLFYSFFYGQSFVDNMLNFEPAKYMIYDSKIGALGPMFGKMFVLSVPIYVYAFLSNLKNFKKYLSPICLFIGLSISVLINYHNIWWLRYAPQIWIYPLFAIYMLYHKNIFFKGICFLMALLFLYQGIFLVYETIDFEMKLTNVAHKIYDENKGKILNVAIRSVVDGQETPNWFYTYEQYRAKEKGVVLVFDKKTDENFSKDYESYYMHYYKIIVIKKVEN